MKEENYEKWLKAKSEVYHFDELDDDVKKKIYDIEQDFQDQWEVELEIVSLKKKKSDVSIDRLSKRIRKDPKGIWL